MIAKRKYNPGDTRKAGEKEYAIILSKLIGYTKKLERENDPALMYKLCKKIIEKVCEIGYKRNSNKGIKRRN